MRFILGSRKIAESLIEESSVTRSAQLALAIQDVEEAESHLAVIGLCNEAAKAKFPKYGVFGNFSLIRPPGINLPKTRLCRHSAQITSGLPVTRPERCHASETLPQADLPVLTRQSSRGSDYR
jgi:hypothetical protein